MQIISPIKIKGQKTIIINWKHRTITDLVNEVRPKIKDIELGGYSIGGTIALILSQELKLKKLVLYSPSPLFKESVNKLSESALKVLGKKRLADANNYSLKNLNVKVKTEIYIGDEEIKEMISFAKVLNKRLNSSLFLVKDCNHYNLMSTLNRNKRR